MHIILASRHNAGKYATVNDLSCLIYHLCHNHNTVIAHDDVIKWKHIPPYRPIVRIIYRLPANFPRKCQWHRALMFSFICAWINGRVSNSKVGVLRRHRAHYDPTVMQSFVNQRGSSLIFLKIAVYIMKYAHFVLLHGCVILNTFLEFCNSVCKMILRINQRMFFSYSQKNYQCTEKEVPSVTQSLCICML